MLLERHVFQGSHLDDPMKPERNEKTEILSRRPRCFLVFFCESFSHQKKVCSGEDGPGPTSIFQTDSWQER